MILRNRGFVNLAACTAISVALWIVWSARLVAAQSNWQPYSGFRERCWL